MLPFCPLFSHAFSWGWLKGLVARSLESLWLILAGRVSRGQENSSITVELLQRLWGAFWKPDRAFARRASGGHNSK